jgi:hypothetical protein
MFNDLLVGVTKLEAFQCNFVTKLYPPKPSPFFKIKMMMSRINLLWSRLALLEAFHRGCSNPRGQQHAQKGPACTGGAVYLGTAQLGGRGAAFLGEQHTVKELYREPWHEIEDELCIALLCCPPEHAASPGMLLLLRMLFPPENAALCYMADLPSIVFACCAL